MALLRTPSRGPRSPKKVAPLDHLAAKCLAEIDDCGDDSDVLANRQRAAAAAPRSQATDGANTGAKGVLADAAAAAAAAGVEAEHEDLRRAYLLRYGQAVAGPVLAGDASSATSGGSWSAVSGLHARLEEDDLVALAAARLPLAVHKGRRAQSQGSPVIVRAAAAAARRIAQGLCRGCVAPPPLPSLTSPDAYLEAVSGAGGADELVGVVLWEPYVEPCVEWVGGVLPAARAVAALTGAPAAPLRLLAMRSSVVAGLPGLAALDPIALPALVVYLGGEPLTVVLRLHEAAGSEVQVGGEGEGGKSINFSKMVGLASTQRDPRIAALDEDDGVDDGGGLGEEEEDGEAVADPGHAAFLRRIAGLATTAATGAGTAKDGAAPSTFSRAVTATVALLEREGVLPRP